ncbi:MAG: hypothetical protein NWF04_10285 [Candidatus Bathyarchaeota archaeon]|nr:hypothetical protein [Candidatus Bathyarchaeota archaeon]
MSSSENAKKEKTTSGIIWLKEGVAASLAIIIIVAILVFLAPALLASPADATSAQAIFAVLGGWGGVVIGYYFGRIPAEKAAEKAEAVAETATQRAEAAAETARAQRDKTEKEKLKEIANVNQKLCAYKDQFKEVLKIIEDAEGDIKQKQENK